MSSLGEQVFVRIDENLKKDFIKILVDKEHKQRIIITRAIEDYIKNKGEPDWL